MNKHIDNTVGKTIKSVKHNGENSTVLTFTDGTTVEILADCEQEDDVPMSPHLEFLPNPE